MKLPQITSRSGSKLFHMGSSDMLVSDPCYSPGTWCTGVLRDVRLGGWNAAVGYTPDDLFGDPIERLTKYYQEQLARIEAQPGTPEVKALIRDSVQRDHERRLEEYKGYLGRVAYLHVWHNSVTEEDARKAAESAFEGFEYQSDIDVGVDSGQAGFYDHERFNAYEDDVYEEVCDLTGSKESFGVIRSAVISSSGYGDGGYNCFILRDSEGKMVQAVIIFIAEYEEEDEDDALDEAEV